MSGYRTGWIFWCLAGLLATNNSMWTLAQQPATGGPAPRRALVSKYCVSCHNDSLKTAGLALDTVSAQRLEENTEEWEKVVRKLRHRLMPPPGAPRPDEAGYNAAVSSLETSLDRAAAAELNPGRTGTFRRLNRAEYQNAIRDLLALDVDVGLLPKVVQFLADKGAEIEIWNRKNKRGWTPLLIAEGHRHGNFKPSPETVVALRRLLVEAGVLP